jgi:GNAT superfamily N-acetyltransferase
MEIIELNDTFYKDYLSLLKQLTFYEYDIDFEEFKNRYENNKNHIKFFILLKDDKLIGAGSIFKLEKLHNNPIGQIEDIVIDEKYRGKGYGKLIVEKLIEYGIKEWNCYKISLNSLEKNLIFYQKMGFINSGYQLKFSFSAK